jgi:hypothetical protein
MAYIYEDLKELDIIKLGEYTKQKFHLCYVERNERYDQRTEDDELISYGFLLWFTNVPLSKQWGDDWNDAPYNYNAGDPYDITLRKDKEGKWQRTEHQILCLKVSLEEYPTIPADYGCNSPFSVEMINQGACAWMYFGGWEKKPLYAPWLIISTENGLLHP